MEIAEKLRKKILELLDKENFKDSEIKIIYKKAIKLKDRNLNTLLAYLYDRWATSIFEENYEEIGIDEKFISALQKQKVVLQLCPGNDKYYYNWANIYKEYSSVKTGVERKVLLKKAIKKYKIAAALNGFYASSFYNWGLSLYELALLNDDKDKKIKLLKKAVIKFENAIAINIWHTEAWNNLGTMYSLLADYDTDKLDYWYHKAIDCYSSLLSSLPHEGLAHDNWGIILKELALREKDAKREKLFIEAIKKHLLAIEQGEGTYNLACTYAALGDKLNALLYLEDAIKNDDGITIQEILEDSDWDPYNEDPLFIELTTCKL